MRRTITEHVPDFIMDRLDGNSPARVMFPIGESIPQGMVVGIERGQSELSRRLREMASAAVDSARVTMPQVSSRMALPNTGQMAAQAANGGAGITQITIPIYRPDGTLEEEYIVDVMNRHVERVYG